MQQEHKIRVYCKRTDNPRLLKAVDDAYNAWSEEVWAEHQDACDQSGSQMSEQDFVRVLPAAGEQLPKRSRNQ